MAKQKEVKKDKLDTGDYEWEGSSVQTDMTLLANDGTGNKVILRVFDFDLPPMKLEERPSVDQLLAVHKTKLTAFLWRDELVPVEKFKLVFSPDNKHFRIFATCQAKAGSVILNEPEVLQHLMHGQPNT